MPHFIVELLPPLEGQARNKGTAEQDCPKADLEGAWADEMPLPGALGWSRWAQSASNDQEQSKTKAEDAVQELAAAVEAKQPLVVLLDSEIGTGHHRRPEHQEDQGKPVTACQVHDAVEALDCVHEPCKEKHFSGQTGCPWVHQCQSAKDLTLHYAGR